MVEYIELKKIKPNPKNPRIIKDFKFDKLVKSIQDFPQMLELRPIVIDSDNVILGGNMRLKALSLLGYKKVPIIRADKLTIEQKAEFIIKDNLSYGEWDYDLLSNEWDFELLESWGLELVDTDIVEPEIDENLIEERYETYVNNNIRQIVLYYEKEQYEDVLNKLDKIGKEHGLEDNSNVVLKLIEAYEQRA